MSIEPRCASIFCEKEVQVEARVYILQEAKGVQIVFCKCSPARPDYERALPGDREKGAGSIAFASGDAGS